MKKLKRTFSLCMALVMVLSCLSISASAVGTDGVSEAVSTHEMREALIAEEFPTAFLDILNDDELLEYYELVIIQGADVQIIRGNTGELYEDAISPQGTIPTADMALDIWLAVLYGSTIGEKTAIASVDVYVTYEWASGHPMVMGTDAIAVNWDSNLFSFAPNTFVSEDIHKYVGEDWRTIKETTRPAELTQGGLGYYTQLTPLDELTDLFKGEARFGLIPKSRVYVGGLNNSSINVTYVHNKMPVIGSISFEIVDGVSVGISLPLLSDSASDSCTFWYQE